MPGRVSGLKMLGMAEVGHQLVWMGWQSIWIVGVYACVIFIFQKKIQKMAKCTFWHQLTRVVPDKLQRAVKWLLCVCVCVCFDAVGWVAGRAPACEKTEWWDVGVVISDEVQTCIWPSRCHCHSLSCAPVNPDWFYLPGFYLSGTCSPG